MIESVPACAIVAGSKDNNDNKYTLHLNGTLLKGYNSEKVSQNLFPDSPQFALSGSST